jgi:hypothetical protein
VFEGGKHVDEDSYSQLSIGRIADTGYVENYLHADNMQEFEVYEVEAVDLDGDGEKEIVVIYNLEGSHMYGGGLGGWGMYDDVLEIRGWEKLDTLLFFTLYRSHHSLECDGLAADNQEGEMNCVETFDTTEHAIWAKILPEESLIQLDTILPNGDTGRGKYYFDSKSRKLKKVSSLKE